MSTLTSIKDTFTQAVTDMLVGINQPGVHEGLSEATTGFGFLTAVGVSTFNPVLTAAGTIGLAVCANQARLAGQSAMQPVTASKPSI